MITPKIPPWIVCYHAWTTKSEIKSSRSPRPIKVVGRSAWQSTDELWSYVSLPNSQRGQFHLTSSVSACAEGITHTLARCGVHPLPLFLSSFLPERGEPAVIKTDSHNQIWWRQGVSQSYECARMVATVVSNLRTYAEEKSKPTA